MAANPGTSIVTKTIFAVNDMGAAIAFYKTLGFQVESFDAGYAWVRHRGAELLHLAFADDLETGANRAAVYFHVQDAASWHQSWVAAGVSVSAIGDYPWQMREFSVRDPSGNLIRIGQNL